MGVKVDLTGQRFNRLTVISETTKRHNSTSCMWLCQCECGNYTSVSTSNLKDGHSKSCGCLSREITSERNKKAATHGHTRQGKISHEYRIWAGIRERCYNVNHTYYHYYGGRGITMYEEWISSFDSFVSYIGTAPSATHTIDRIDNDGNYEPNNIRWATRKEQANNRSNTPFFEYKGEMKTITELAEIADINYSTMKHRLASGWDIERAMNRTRTRKTKMHLEV